MVGCESPGQDAIVFAIATAPVTLHPLHASDAVSERINALIYRPLVEFDQARRPLPGLIDWERLSPEHYRLRLRSDIQSFSDGSVPSLKDLEATIRDAGSDSRSPHAGTLSHVRSLTVLENEFVDVHLSRPDPRFPEKLHLGLAPAEKLDGNTLARAPVGNGQFVLEKWDAHNSITLRRSDGQLLRFEVVSDPTMRVLKLMRGEVHVLQNDLPYELYPMLQKHRDISLQANLGTTFTYLGFNLEDSLTGDRRIRTAIAHAVNREKVVRYLFQGRAETANTLLRPEHWAAQPELSEYTYDPERAEALLGEMGYNKTNPLKLSYKTSTDPFRLRIAAALQAQLAEVGIHMDIQSYEWGTFFADIKDGRFQMYSLSWVGIRSPDIFRYVYHSDSFPPRGANRGRYHSPIVDALIEKADRLPSDKAAALYQQAQTQIHQDLVYVPLWHEHNLLITRGIQSPGPSVDGSYNFLGQVSLKHD